MDQTINVGGETITQRDIGIAWKVICVLGLVLGAVGGPTLTWYLASSHEDSDLRGKVAAHEIKIDNLKEKVASLEREMMFMRNRMMNSGPFPGVSPR